ncbi:MAG: FHA domain-containing protein [Gammaproteobacteria bacterium]|nr:FHA domain-containing protein [Gammaproteobacteria bacterium]
MHRLEVAGSHGRKLFADDTYPIIFRYTGGVPRLINTLCDTALMGAYGLEQTRIGINELNAAIEELQWVEFPSRINRVRAALMVAPAPKRVAPEDVLARIIVAHAGERVEERPLRLGRLIIGRTPENDLQIDSKFISRHHCQITTTAEGSVLEDLNSTNGVYLKSKRVRKHHLNDGDVIVLGKHEIMYLDERSVRTRMQDAGDSTGDHEIIDEDEVQDEEEDDQRAPSAGAN